MKVQKISGNNKKVITFSVNETSYSAVEGRASISIPSKIFKGKGRVKLVDFACVHVRNSSVN